MSSLLLQNASWNVLAKMLRGRPQLVPIKSDFGCWAALYDAS